MQIEKNKKINEAIDLLIKGGVDLKTVLSQNGMMLLAAELRGI
ncbi:hypothetical protein [Rickettsia endosymbiont of Urophora cardui]